MPEDGFFQGSGAAVMHEGGFRVDDLGQAYSPQWWCAPLLAIGLVGRTKIRKALTHVMQEQIGIWKYGLIGKRCDFMWAGHVFRRMAAGAIGLIKKLFAFDDFRIIEIPLCWNSQCLKIKGKHLRSLIIGIILTLQSLYTIGLSITMFSRKIKSGEPHIIVRRIRSLLACRWLFGFPAEPSDPD